MIHYTVDLNDAIEGRLHVTLRTHHPGGRLELAVAAWIPGSYLLREFIRYFGEFEATLNGTAFPLERGPRATFVREHLEAGELVLRWSVFAQELTVRTPHADATHAFFNGCNILAYLPSRMAETHHVRVTAPPAWEVYSPLVAEEGDLVADNWDVLADTPFECGPHHRVHRWEIDGVPHRYIFWGHEAVDLDLDKLVEATTSLVRMNAARFGGVPYANYDFIVHITQSGRGGLEHANSTTLAVPWSAFSTDDDWRDLLGLIAHEHLHVWNGKRIRPVGLGPFDYQREAITRGLWWVEGATSYLDDRTVLATHLLSPSDYLGLLERALRRFESLPGRFAQSVTEASQDAWFRLYRPDADSPNRTVSYYLRGQLICLALDGFMRKHSTQGASVETVLQRLWARTMETGQAWIEEDIVREVESLSNESVAEHLRQWLDERGDIHQLDQALAWLGVERTTEPETTGWHGLTWAASHTHVTVQHLLRGSPAARSGLSAEDRLLTWNEREVQASTMESMMEQAPPGSRVDVTVTRRGRVHHAGWTVGEPQMRSKLRWASHADEATQRRRAAWLYREVDDLRDLSLE